MRDNAKRNTEVQARYARATVQGERVPCSGARFCCKVPYHYRLTFLKITMKLLAQCAFAFVFGGALCLLAFFTLTLSLKAILEPSAQEKREAAAGANAPRHIPEYTQRELLRQVEPDPEAKPI